MDHLQGNAVIGRRCPRSRTRLVPLRAAFAACAMAATAHVAHAGAPAPGRPLVFAPPVPDADAPLRVCSMRLPLCLRTRPTESGPATLAVLRAAEDAWETLTGALALPPPDVDPDTLAYDLVLSRGLAEDAETRVVARDSRSRVDRARGYTVVGAAAAAGCALRGAIARELGRAILLRVSPGTDEATAEAQATYVSELVEPCARAYAGPAARAFQQNPDRSPADARAGDGPGTERAGGPSQSRLFARGASLFWSRLDWAYARAPGGLVRATWALSPTTTAPNAATWSHEPDAFDVLRTTFGGAHGMGTTFDDLLLDTAIARAFLGDDDDGLHQPETRVLADSARVALDWDLPFPVAPKRLAPRAPVAPGGASYVAIHVATAPPNARLRAEISWEEHALFRWAFVKVDARGREIGRVVVPPRGRVPEAQMTLVDLAGADRVLLVGAQVGDPTSPFDPDDAAWEPHAWLVTLAAE